MTGVRIRRATEADTPALERLADLDSRTWPGGDALVAEVRGELLAAVPLGDGPAIADPFKRTMDLVDLLELRREQLVAEQGLSQQAARRLLRSPARA